MNENRLTTLQHIRKCLNSVKALVGKVLDTTVDAITELEKKIPTKVSELENDEGFLTKSYYNAFSRSADGLVPHPTTTTITRYLREDGSWEVPPDNNTDVNVTQINSTAAISYPILLKNGTGTGSVTTTTLFNSGITVTPSTSTITATNFAGIATKAAQDGDGNNIVDTYATKAYSRQSIETAFDTAIRAMFGLFENKAFSWTKCTLYPNAMSWSGYPACRFTYVPASVCAANVGKQILLKFNNFLCLTTIKKTTSGSETYYYFNGTTWYSNESPATFGNANGNTTGGRAWTDNPTGSIGFTLNDGAVVFMTGTSLAVPDAFYYIL